MSDLKVTTVGQQGAPDQYGNVSYWVNVEGVAGGILVKHKPDKPVMQVGDTFEKHGYVGYEEVKKKDNSGSYFKAKRPQQQQNFPNNGPRPEDPARAKRIVRQHSQDMAIATLNLAAVIGTWPREAVPDTVNDLVQVVKKLADAYEKDANG